PDLLYLTLVGGQSLTTTSNFLPEWTQAENEKYTGAGLTESHESSQSLIRNLRKISGLTWEQLAKLFNTSRRTLHYWDNGNAMAADNHEKLVRILAAVGTLDTGNATENRRLLLTNTEGCIPFDLLKQERFEDFEQIKGYFNRRTLKPQLSASEIQARSPLPLDRLVDAKSERIHTERRKKRKAKTERAKKV
ncbi:MAG: helix-turn-helix transcriptional regulator, partial [Bdellovibrionales bacterium]|nr:helix-turn-helix transcriptional regulator [Bdellovibrionales bacterium]